MKKNKRVVLFLLSMVLVFSMAMSGIMTVSAADTTAAATDNLEYRVGLLEALKISKVSGVGITEWSGNLTRGEAAFLVAGLIQLDRSKRATVFDDVSEDAFYAGSVASLYDEGIVLKNWGSKRFKPDEPINYAEFVTMICKALGYTGYAEAKGGYPSGYSSVARQFKITSGMPALTTTTIDKANVPKLLMNALDAYYLTVTYIDSDGSQTATRQGVVVEDYFDVYKYEGILQEASYYTITGNFVATDTQINVGDVNFNISKSANTYYDLLGQQVTVYFKEGKDVVYIYPKSDNEVMEFDAEDLLEPTSANMVSYYEGASKRNIKIASDRTVVYNGTLDNSADIVPEYGKVQFVDNNGDGKYDIIKVMSYEVATVSHVDTSNKVVVLDNGMEMDIDTNSNDLLSVTGTNGKVLKPSSLVKDDIVLVAKNGDANHNIYNVIVGKIKVEGSVTGYAGDEIAIAGTAYPLAEKFFPAGVSCSMGDTVTAYTDELGRVFYLDVEGYNYKNAKYAAYLGMYKVKDGSKPSWEIELLTQDGAYAAFPVAEKIKLNGTKYEVNDTDALDFLNGIAYASIVKYNAVNGEITEVITPNDWGTEYRLWELGQGFNKYTSSNTYVWRTSGVGAFGSWLGVASGAVRFQIELDENGRINKDKSGVSTAKLTNDQNVSEIVLYDIDKSGMAHAYTASPSKSTDVLGAKRGSPNNSFLCITKVIEMKNANGDNGILVKGLMGGAEKEFFLSEDSYFDAGMKQEDYEAEGLAAASNPYRVGNIVRVQTVGNEIVGIMKSGNTGIAYTKEELTNPNYVGGNQKNYDAARPNVWMSFCIMAKVVFVEDGKVYFANSDTAGSAISSSSAFMMPEGGIVYKYDPDGDDIFKVVSWNDVKESDGLSGMDSELSGSTVLVNANGYAITEIFILD